MSIVAVGAPLPYRDLAAGLRAELGGATMTILKGALDYRRLVGDRLWPPTAPFAETAGHLPSPSPPCGRSSRT